VRHDDVPRPRCLRDQHRRPHAVGDRALDQGRRPKPDISTEALKKTLLEATCLSVIPGSALHATPE
jgi:hypothetical protein